MVRDTIWLAPLLTGFLFTGCDQSVCDRVDSYMTECGYAPAGATTSADNTTAFGVCSEDDCDEADLLAWDRYYNCLDDRDDMCSNDALIECGSVITTISGACRLSLGGVSSPTSMTAE